jgi:hypothetical protein
MNEVQAGPTMSYDRYALAAMREKCSAALPTRTLVTNKALPFEFQHLANRILESDLSDLTELWHDIQRQIIDTNYRTPYDAGFGFLPLPRSDWLPSEGCWAEVPDFPGWRFTRSSHSRVPFALDVKGDVMRTYRADTMTHIGYTGSHPSERNSEDHNMAFRVDFPNSPSDAICRMLLVIMLYQWNCGAGFRG